MRVLVTGAAGRIGRVVVEYLRSRGASVTGLVLEDPGDLDIDSLVVGDSADADLVGRALRGTEAVVHLAAIPTPEHIPARAVFEVNTRATFTVLEAAGLAGVRRVAIASSYGATGLPWSRGFHSPEYLPLDIATPALVEDPYGLSKQVDELTAAAMSRRYGTTVVALRYPYVGGVADRLVQWAARLTEQPELGARELWAYLDTRDAARAAELALTVAADGCHVVYVAASQTAVPYRTEALLDRFHPSAQRRRPLPGRSVPIDLEPARELLGFEATFELAIQSAELPQLFT